MTHTYQNTDFVAGRSVFTDVTNEDSTAVVTFTSKPLKVSTPKGPVKMTRARVVLRQDADATFCEDECPALVTESISIEFNVLRGSNNLSALRTEVNRLLSKALSAYKFDVGIVPPSSADINEA